MLHNNGFGPLWFVVVWTRNVPSVCDTWNHVRNRVIETQFLEVRMILTKNCKVSICNDTSFSHLSAALEIETIVLMTDSPLLYGSYSPKMHPIIPDGETTVTHNTLGKDKINPEKIFNKMKVILKLS